MKHAQPAEKPEPYPGIHGPMISNGIVHTIKSISLRYRRASGGDASPETGRCARLCRLRQVSFFLALACVFVVVAYRGVLHNVAAPRVHIQVIDTDSAALQGVALAEGAGTGAPDRIRIRHTKRRLPQCIIIGVRKAGTRALLTFLGLHPQVQVANDEVHFFDDDEAYSYGFDWYRKHMPYSFPGQVTIEKTPAYFKTYEAPERVYKMNASVKLLLIVRDPTERAVSDYVQIRVKKLAKGKTYASFAELALTEDGEVNASYAVVRRSLYYKYLRNWLYYFSRRQMHVVDGARLVSDPIGELAAVEEFLGLKHRITRDMLYYNRSRGFYCVQNATAQRCLNESKGRAHPDVAPHVIRKLRKYFRPYNQKFFHMVGREFNWPSG